jgi:hypothetical protein
VSEAREIAVVPPAVVEEVALAQARRATRMVRVGFGGFVVGAGVAGWAMTSQGAWFFVVGIGILVGAQRFVERCLSRRGTAENIAMRARRDATLTFGYDGKQLVGRDEHGIRPDLLLPIAPRHMARVEVLPEARVVKSLPAQSGTSSTPPDTER